MKLLFIISLLVMIKRHANKTKEGINKGITILSFSSPVILESCASFLLLNLFTNSKKNISLNFADCSVNGQKCIVLNRCFCRHLQNASVQVIREIADQKESVFIILQTFLHSKISTKIKKMPKNSKILTIFADCRF